ncbi:sigma 54-interacting transcriptional regulator [uncultured Desulfobacter sp.]|uniref:sigma 54-interacting transcriptional regulator n=1 Tax=uncultured Desulfobacter sp. TaxID=240139 RepID=UPI00259BBC6D|nr:sigma 54-interacting transcriptional regulator [uncultured Desulfobacter sp.]
MSPYVGSTFDFEGLVEKIAGQFIGMSDGDIDPAIQRAQKEICQHMGFDGSLLWLFENTTPENAIVTYMYSPSIQDELKKSGAMAERFPWIMSQIRQGLALSFSSLEDFPVKAKSDANELKRMGIKSLIISPMRSETGIIGGISFCRMTGKKAWESLKCKQVQAITQILSNILCLKFKEKKNNELYRFEKLISNISARFINLPAHLLDDQINRAQAEICQTLNIEQSALWLWSDTSPHYLTVTHLHTPPYGPEKPVNMKADIAFPWAIKRVLKGEIFTISTHDMPEEARIDRETRIGLGVDSSLVLPLCSGEKNIIGALSFDTIKYKIAWTDAVVDRMTLVSQIFTNALVRRRQELKLMENERRLSMATEAGNLGIWVLEINSRHVWVTQRLRDLFGFESDVPLNYESFTAKIFDQDRDMVTQTVNDALDSIGSFDINFRTVHPNGKLRWVRSSGKVYCNSQGDPRHLMGITLDISKQKRMEQQLENQIAQIKTLKQKIENENTYLRQEINVQFLHDEIIARSPEILRVIEQIEQVALTEASVLIQGETGTGKELLARAIHRLSNRKDRPLVTINCASLPPTLVESELFGREKGAYTGALTRMAGRFELADKATLFLDEVGEMPMEIQAKLLRVLEQGKFERLGSTQTIEVDVRIIAATNKNIEQMMDEGKFRKDLYFRLNVFPIHVPPLRERLADIPPLTWAFVREFEKKMARRVDNIPTDTMKALQKYTWPGNIRELKNLIERSLITSNSKTLNVTLPVSPSHNNKTITTLEAMERRHIQDVLEKTNWRISGKGSAAEVLGLKRTTLQSKMKKLGIQRP